MALCHCGHDDAVHQNQLNPKISECTVCNCKQRTILDHCFVTLKLTVPLDNWMRLSEPSKELYTAELERRKQELSRMIRQTIDPLVQRFYQDLSTLETTQLLWRPK